MTGVQTAAIYFRFAAGRAFLHTVFIAAQVRTFADVAIATAEYTFVIV